MRNHKLPQKGRTNTHSLMLLSFLVVALMIIPMGSAAEWDNVYTYDEETKTVTIENWLGLGEDLAYLTLTSPHNKIVHRGIDVLVGEFNYTGTENFTDVFNELYLTDLKNGNSISRGSQYKYKKYIEVSVDDYGWTNCEDALVNGTMQEVCSWEEVGSHLEIQMDWIPIGNPNNEFEANLVYEIGVFVDVEEGDWGDWIPSIMGVEIEEWAEWNESWSFGLISYYSCEDDLATTDVLDYFELNDGTSTVDTDTLHNANGIIESAFDFVTDTGKYVEIGDLDIFSSSTYTINAWINTTYGGDVSFFGEGSSVATTPLYKFGMLSNHAYIFLREPGFLRLVGEGSSVVNDGVFHMITFSANGASWVLYVDGEIEGSGSMTNPTTTTEQTVLGSDYDAGNHNNAWDGTLDEVSIFNRTVGQGEIRDFYGNGTGSSPAISSGTPPVIALTSPINNSNLTSSSQDFIAIVTDDLYVENVSLKIDGVIVSTNTSHINGSYTFPQTISTGHHNWSVLAYDNESLSAESDVWFFNFTIPPINIDLQSPDDNSNHTTALINISCSSYHSAGVTFLQVVDNGTTIILITNSTPGENLSISQFFNFTEGTHNWKCSAGNAEVITDSEFRTFNVDTISPVIDLTAPPSVFEYLLDNQTLNLNWTVNDSNLDSCWYTYGPWDNISEMENIANSSMGISDGVNVFTGEESAGFSSGKDIVRMDKQFGATSYLFLTMDYSTTNLQYSSFDEDTVPNCIDATYGSSDQQIDSANIGKYGCFKGEDDRYVVGRITEVGSSNIRMETYEEREYIDCSLNTTEFNYIAGIDRIGFVANDTFGNYAYESRGWTYTILEVSQSFNANTVETALETFSIDIDYLSGDWSSMVGNLNYGNESYLGINTGSGDSVSISRDVYVTNVAADGNRTFNWTISLTNSTGTYNFTSSNQVQYITKVNFTSCNYSESPQLFFQTFSTTNPTTPVNATFASAWTIRDSTGGTIALSRSFEDLTEVNSTWGFCIEPNTTTYTVSIDIVVDAADYTPTSHYIVDTDYVGTGANISLYLLNDSEATLTELKVTDVDNQPVEGAYITIQRYDVGTDTYYNVGQARTDSSGSDLTYLKWYDDWYRFIIVVDGSVVLTDGPKKVSSSPLDFQIGADYTPYFQKFDDIEYSLTFNNATDNFVLTFVDTAGTVSSSCLKVIKRNITNDYLICDDCETSSSATLYCNIGAWGNGTFIGSFYAIGSPFYIIDVLYHYVEVQQQLYDLIGSDNGTGMAIILAGVVLSFFLISPGMGVFGMMLGMVLVIALGFQPFEMVSFMGVMIVGVLVMWAVKK